MHMMFLLNYFNIIKQFVSIWKQLNKLLYTLFMLETLYKVYGVNLSVKRL